MLKRLILLLALSCSAFGQLINPHELPFGCYSSTWAEYSNYFTDDRLRIMHDSLGFNQHMCGGFTLDAIGRFMNEGIAPYSWGTDDSLITDWQVSYAECQYLICQPESSDYYNCKFKSSSGIQADSSVGYVYGANGDSLYGLDFCHPSKYNNVLDDGADIQYYPELRIKVSSRTQNDDSNAVAIYKAYRHCCGLEPETSTVFIDTIKFGRLTGTQFTEMSLKNYINRPDSFFYTRPHSNTVFGDWVNHKLEICAPCTVYVDWFKLHCQNGKLLIENPTSLQNQRIIESIRRPEFGGRILGWFLKDTEQPGNYRPMAHIDSLIRYASGWTNPVRGVAWVNTSGIFNSHAQNYRDFVRITKPTVVWTYLYPIGLGTKYSGYENLTWPNGNYFYSESLQTRFEKEITIPLDSMRTAMTSILGPKAKWLYTPQYWYWINPDSSEPRRAPTKSEVRCMTYLGMCYHTDGILGWRLESDNDSTLIQGVMHPDLSLSQIGEAIRYDINPYIKAVDSVYTGLFWGSSMPYRSGLSGQISYIQSIDTIPGSNLHNPDAGWFQVGLFKDSDSTNYFMLVNRACSQGVDDPTEAPPVTAVIKLNPSVVDRNYAYIIDVAKSINKYSVGGLMHWDPIPETTYSALMGQTIPFTVTLKAGEGRLFKVIPAPNLTDLSDGIDSALVYEGKLGITKNTTVQNNQKLRLRGPSIIYIEPNKKITLNKYSKLQAEGHAGNEIVFSPPQNSSWLGITMDTSATIDLRYCLIDSAGCPIYAKAHNTIELNNCSIILCDDAIVAHGNPSAIKIDSCTFRESKSTGITAIEPDTFIISQSLLQNDDYVGLYGIYVENALDKVEFYWTKVSHFFDYGIKYIGGNSTEDPVFFGDSLFGQGNGYSSAGLYVAKKGEEDRVRPMINELYSEYFNSGIELVGTDYGTTLGDCNGSITCRYNDLYGLYLHDDANAWLLGKDECTNSIIDNDFWGIFAEKSWLRVRYTRLGGNIYTGAEIYSCNANFGDSAEPGNNHFGRVEGSSYSLLAYDCQVPAIYNYWGTTDEDDIKDRVTEDVLWIPYLRDPPFNYKHAVNSLQMPTSLTLESSYPNPFNIQAKIDYMIPAAAHVSLKIYNILGQEINELVNQEIQPGYYSIIWNGIDRFGSPVSSGVYLYSLKTPDKVITKKMVMLK